MERLETYSQSTQNISINSYKSNNSNNNNNTNSFSPRITSPISLQSNASSISFYIYFSPPKLSQPNHQLNKYTSKQVLTIDILRKKLENATSLRKKLLQNRVFKLHRRNELVKQKSQLLLQQNRLTKLQFKLKTDYQLRMAYLKRQIIIQRLVERCSKRVEKAQAMAVMIKLQRCIELKKSFSTSFAELLGDLPNDLDFISLQSEVNEYTTTTTTTTNQIPQQQQTPTIINTTTTTTTTTAAATVERKRSLSIPIEMRDEREFKDLSHVFGDLQPTITKNTLKELNLDSISSNAQLRHDMIFDPNLEFRPNDDGERGEMKRSKADLFWEKIENDLKQGQLKKIPVLINEIKEILIDLVATDEYRKSLETRLDILLIAQQLEHNVFDVGGLIEYLADIMKAHCAPIRDSLIDLMLADCRQGNFSKSLRACFEILEKMKLDVANDQLRRLRPFVLENAVEFEWELFKESLRDGSLGLQNTLKWLQPHINKQSVTNASNLLMDAYLSLIQTLTDTSADDKIPETFRMDAGRLSNYHNEWQDLTIMACLLILYRQAAGSKATQENLLEMKKSMWVLLNDSETTIVHLCLHLSDSASKIRGSPFTKAEEDILANLIDKTLSPDSKLYELMSKRVGEQLKSYLITKNLMAVDELSKNGLFELADEIRDLGERMRFLFEHNKSVYHKVYNQIISSQNK